MFIYLSLSTVLKLILQIFGIILIICNLDSDEHILAKSSTYLDCNTNLIEEYLKERYLKCVGILSFTISNIFETLYIDNVYIYFIGLFIEIISLFLRKYYIKKHKYKLIEQLKTKVNGIQLDKKEMV